MQVGQRKIVILGTGGTIAGTAATAHDSSRYQAAQRGIDELLQGVPRAAWPQLELVTEQVAQIDSKDMDDALWRRLLARCRYWLDQPEVAGLVLTHGTDTLEETAYFLHATLGADKPVVLTCAMRPATSLQADGPQNLLDALHLAAQPQARGVLVTCAGTIHGAVEVQKVHTWRLDAFGSGDAGALGHVVHGRVLQHRAWPVSAPVIPTQVVLRMAEWPRVEIVMSHAGAGAALVDALLADTAAAPLRGLVVAGTGGGTVHQALEAALLRARDAGVRVLRATRCAGGGIQTEGVSALPHGAMLSPVKARIALMLELLAREAATR